MKKRIVSMVLVIVLALSLCVPAMAASTTENVAITYRAIKIQLNGKEITPCDAAGNTVEPFIMNSNGTTYLPLRAIGQALGLDVKWDGVANTVTLTSGGEVKTGAGAAGTTTGTKNVAITYRGIKVILDGKQLDLVNAKGEAVEPFILNSNSSVYLPLRVVGESLGLEVGWDSATSTAILGKAEEGIVATGITLNKEKIWLYPGDTYQLVATVTPADAKDKSVTWTSSDSSIASVSSTGLVTMNKAGTVTITAKTTNGLTASCAVVVMSDAATGITLNKDKIWLYPGDTYQLVATVTPADAKDKSVTWTSSDSSIASVSSTGLVTMNKAGTVTITAKTANGLTASCTVVVMAIVTLYSVDDRVVEVKEGEVDSYLKLGWYKTRVGLSVVDEGVYKYYSEGEYPWVYGSSFLYIGGEGALESYSAPWKKYSDNIYGVYLKYGLTSIDSFAFDDWSALRRVEIPDTVTRIEDYAFSDSSLLRIGIPASVTYINNYMLDIHAKPSSSSNANVVIYCEKGSAAETWAKKYGIAYQYATIVYFPDGRTCMVTDAERPVYLRNGWYSVPVTTLYAADGREKVVALSEVEKHLAVGWYEDKSGLYTTMYALDGRTKEVLNINISSEQKVGWYLYADYICALADQQINQSGWEAGLDYLDGIIKKTASSDPDRAKFEAKKADICAKWLKQLGDPLAITDVSVKRVDDYPRVYITFRNISTKTITSLEAFWTCIDSYGNVTTDYPYLYNGNFIGWDEGISIDPGESYSQYWILYDNERTASVRNLRMERCAFSDGTSWYYTAWYS